MFSYWAVVRFMRVISSFSEFSSKIEELFAISLLSS